MECELPEIGHYVNRFSFKWPPWVLWLDQFLQLTGTKMMPGTYHEKGLRIPGAKLIGLDFSKGLRSFKSQPAFFDQNNHSG
jgi:hypothetical protein